MTQFKGRLFSGRLFSGRLFRTGNEVVPQPTPFGGADARRRPARAPVRRDRDDDVLLFLLR